MTLEIDDYLARGEAKAVLAKHTRVEGYECTTCPKFTGKGKRLSLALALRHFRTIEHRRHAARRRTALRSSASGNDSRTTVDWDDEFTPLQTVDDAMSLGDPFSDSEKGVIRRRDQWTPDDLLGTAQRAVTPDDSVGDSQAPTPRFADDDLNDDQLWDNGEQFCYDNLETEFDSEVGPLLDLEDVDDSRNTETGLAPPFQVLDAFKEDSRSSRSRTSKIPDPTDEWYPFPGPMMCALATFYQSPQERLSKRSLGRILSLLHVFGLNPPSVKTVSGFLDNLAQEIPLFTPKSHTLPNGRVLYYIPPSDFAKAALAIPDLASQITCYPAYSTQPETQKHSAAQAWRWRADLPPEVRSPMARSKGRDFFCQEVSRLPNNQFVFINSFAFLDDELCAIVVPARGGRHKQSCAVNGTDRASTPGPM